MIPFWVKKKKCGTLYLTSMNDINAFQEMYGLIMISVQVSAT